jgi:hypothetical protein
MARSYQELDGPAVSALGVRSQKLSNIGRTSDGWPNLEFLRASKSMLSCWSRLYLQSLAPTNLHWARGVGYSPFSLWVIHKESLCPSSRDINRLMMMMMMILRAWHRISDYSAVIYPLSRIHNTSLIKVNFGLDECVYNDGYTVLKYNKTMSRLIT